ncbi:MAG: hypothetical protein ABSB69_17360 [Solirubrobacteraceae bacterium]
MSRRSAARKSKLDRLRVVPWIAVAQAGVVIGRHWQALSEKERARLTRLARESRGRPGTLSTKERAELRGLVGKLDLKGIGRELLPLARRRRGRRGRSRART